LQYRRRRLLPGSKSGQDAAAKLRHPRVRDERGIQPIGQKKNGLPDKPGNDGEEVTST
jgi:hypothetical protein